MSPNHLFVVRRRPAGRPRVVALTGPIAGGKSLALRFFAELGARTVDADEVTHELYGAGGALAPALAALFGPGVMAADGSVDRSALARIVFSDASALRVLNTTVHPLVRARLAAWREEVRACAGAIGVAAIPLLFEAGLDGDWDATACLEVPEEVLVPRLLARGLTEAEAQARLEAQLPPAEKAARADYLLPNTGTPEALRAVCADFLAALRED